MQAITYARVSTLGQAEHGYSLNDQRAMLAAHCQAHGYTLLEHVADEGISGRLEDRPGLQRILQLAEAGAIGCVVAVNLKRLGRENRIIQDALHTVRKRGVRVEFTEHGSGDTPAGRLLENVLGGVAEFEWEEIRLRTTAGRLQKAKEKKVMPCGAPPFGYKLITRAEAAVLPEYHGRSGEYILIPEEAEVVRELFKRYAAGESLYHLVKWAKEQPCVLNRPRSSTGFARSGMALLLRNPAYVGRPEYRRREKKIVAGKERRIPRPEGERVVLQCPAIVDEELFAAVQQRFEANKEQMVGRPSGRWLLTGCIFCGECLNEKGEPRRGHASGGHLKNQTRRYYQCNNRCGARVRAEELEELARVALIEAAKPHRLAELERQRAEAAAKAAGDPSKALAESKKALAALDVEEGKILDLALSGFSQQVIAQRLATLNEKRAALQQKLAEAQGRAALIQDPREAAARGEAAAARLREWLEDPEKFRDLARLFLTVRIFPNKRTQIEVRVPPAFGLSGK